MPSKGKPRKEKDLEAYEATRDLAAELLQSVLKMKAGQVHVITSPVIEARKKTGLSQSQFAVLLGGLSAHCRDGNRVASSLAVQHALLAIASKNPKALL